MHWSCLPDLLSTYYNLTILFIFHSNFKSLDCLRNYFFKNEPLISWTFQGTFLSSKLDPPVIKTLEWHTLKLKGLPDPPEFQRSCSSHFQRDTFSNHRITTIFKHLWSRFWHLFIACSLGNREVYFWKCIHVWKTFIFQQWIHIPHRCTPCTFSTFFIRLKISSSERLILSPKANA